MTTTLSATARRLLPVGRPLPEEDWALRHRGIVALLWIHAPALFVFGLIRGLSPGHAFFEGLAIAVPALVATSTRPSREIRMVAATFGLVASSAVLVHVSGGVIEMHFHYFVVVAIITLYQSWGPFLLAVAFVLFQHGLMGVIDPATVFNHPAAIANPWRWASIHAAFIAAESVGCLTAWRVSEAERARADEFDRQLATLVQFSDDAILGLDERGRVANWNPAAERLFGYPAAEVLGSPITKLAAPDRSENALAFFARVAGGESVQGYEGFGRARDGRRIPLSVTASPITDAQGGLLGVSLIARDITRRKEAEEQLAAARDEALKLSRLKSEFLANMSHEIRTPMNGVLGMTSLLLATDLDPAQREYAETVRRSGDALLTIIDEILDFSKIEAGKARLHTTDFDVRSVVEDVAALLAPLAEEKGLDLVRLVHPGVPARANGDPGRLRQVLTNLAGNAIRFTEKGEVVVRVRTEEGGGGGTRLRFDVTDTGVGIPLEAQGKLFQSFYQVDSSSTRSAGGTGLGLAISRELVHLMGGEIGVQSRPGAGSTFSFTIQVRRPVTPAGPPAPSAELEGRRALVVAADGGLAHTLRRLVEGTGMRADLAATPEQALTRLREQPPGRDGYAVVVADNDLPGVGGVGLARQLTAHGAVGAVPVFLVTVRGRRGDAEAARLAGVSGYL
ncbi:MAG: ATP-binding protein, partial [Actinomycetota bacterium]